MIAETRSCRGCRSEYRVTDEQIDRILSSPMFQSAACVPDAVYEERLRMCGECPKLIDGHTCAMCGCIVRVAAKLKAKSCPDPGKAGWRQYEG